MRDCAALMDEVRACQLCRDDLPHAPRPVIQMSPQAKLLIAGQAPGQKVHDSGVPFDDASGERLRSWLGIDREVFYDPQCVAILPMGFCFPGVGKQGDLPPKKLCATTWRQALLEQLSALELTLLIGRYAIDWHLPQYKKMRLSDVIQTVNQDASNIFVLPHPSPRNNIWLSQHPWFEAQVLPRLKAKVEQLSLTQVKHGE